MTALSKFLPLLLLGGPLSAQYAQFSLPVGAGAREGTIHLFLFDTRSVTLKVIDQGGLQDQAHANLGEAMKVYRCAAGCNGGSFSPAGEPLGLAIADGRTTGTVNLLSSLTSGVLHLDGTRLRLTRSKAYFAANPTLPNQLLQAGPFLVENGRTVAGLDAANYSRRSFILTDGGHRWAIGYCPSTSLSQLAATLADPKSFPNFNVATALHLDGGSSSGLWIRTDHQPFYLREIKPVRNFLGIITKGDR